MTRWDGDYVEGYLTAFTLAMRSRLVLVLDAAAKRQLARAEGEWAAADKLRDYLADGGLALRDEPDGTTVISLRFSIGTHEVERWMADLPPLDATRET